MNSLDGQQVIWTPQPRQQIALSCPADELLYGGAKGGGKSDYLLAAPFEQIALADTQWRSTKRKQRGRAILFRKNLKHLDDLIHRSKELFPEIDPGAEWFKIEKRWVFASGYRFDFAHLDGPDDHTAYHGQEITALLFDQVEEIPFEVYQYLCANVRAKDLEMRKLLVIRCTANPGGKYASWVKDYFIAPCRDGHRIIRETQKLSRGRTKVTTKAFIPAKLGDNAYLDNDPDYEARLRKLPAHMQRMFLDGDWDVVIGSYFAHAWDASVHLKDSFPIPGSWEVKFGMDWGTVAPACVIVGARDNDGNVYAIDEIYAPGGTGRQFGDRIVKKFTTQRWSNDKKWTVDDVYGLLDYEAWAKRGEEGPTAAVSMTNMGIRLFKANKNRAAGNEQVLERLATFDVPITSPSEALHAHPAGGMATETRIGGQRVQFRKAAKLYIFRDRCPNLARTLPNLRADPKNPNDVDTDDEDHAYDALKYLLLDWPITAGAAQSKEDRDVQRWLDLARQRDRIASNESTTGY